MKEVRAIGIAAILWIGLVSSIQGAAAVGEPSKDIAADYSFGRLEHCEVVFS